ncbi:MAG: RNA polymerase sigma factor [Actinobacteria bacterium]|nr:RNA polymerase sigma factor [Actinomycetota bacterium]
MTAIVLRPRAPLWPRLCQRVTAWFAAAAAAPPAEVSADVVAAARQGDHGAFARIVSHYDHQLRGLAFRVLGDQARMDDVMQDAYVKAFQALPRFKGDARLGTWLFRITYNACIDEVRRAGRRETTPFSRPDHALPADAAIEGVDLTAALGKLPPDQRAAVLLVDAYGYDYAEAAAILGVREGTVGSRLTRARTALRTTLGWSER